MLLNLDSPKQPAPPELKGELKIHQKTSLYACLQLESKLCIQDIVSKVGIIADPVGSGKTFVAICLCLMNDPLIKQIPHFTTGFYYLTNDTDYLNTINCNLIIIPHGLVSMWKNTLQKYFPSVKFQCIRFSKDVDNFILNSETKIVLLSSTRLRQFCDNVQISKNCWKRVFYEEADSINIPANRNIRSKFYWLITATPRRLFPYHRSTGFLRQMVHSLYNLCYTNNLKKILIKNSYKTIEHSIKLPSVKNKIIRCLIPPQLRQLRKYVSQQVLEALNAGDIDSALTLLNCKVESKENLTKAIKEDLEFKLSRANAKLRYQMDIGSNDEIIKLTLKKITGLKQQITSIIERIESQKHCPICLDNLNNRCTLECCHHWFCLQCLTQAIQQNSKCPLCRNNTLMSQIIVESKKKISNKKNKNVLPFKKDALLNLLQENKKTLVFSNYNNSFLNIEKELQTKNISFAHVKGHSSSIEKLIHNYKQGNLKILLLNSNYQGSGHNLENTERILLVHHLKRIKQQVIGRAQRLGRNKSLEVVELLYPKEEEKVLNNIKFFL